MPEAPVGALLRSSLRHRPCLGCRTGSSWAGWTAVCAPGSVLRSGDLMGALYLGLAWVYWDQSEEMRKKIYSGE